MQKKINMVGPKLPLMPLMWHTKFSIFFNWGNVFRIKGTICTCDIRNMPWPFPCPNQKCINDNVWLLWKVKCLCCTTGCPEDDLSSNVAGIPGILSPIKLIFHMLNEHMMRFFLVYRSMVIRLICLGKYGATLEHVGKSQNPDSCVSG